MTIPARFTEELLTRPPTGGLDVVTKLRHFAIITYALPPEVIRPHVHNRFDLDTYVNADGDERAWLSVVPFQDADFHFVSFPWAKFHMGQTNYRVYVIDKHTGKPAVWFLGTTLGGVSIAIPRYLWKLPWHPGRFHFDVAYDSKANRYGKYHVSTRSTWASAQFELEDSGKPVTRLQGFNDLEEALVKLTHPLDGFYYRRDGSLGSYSIWHDRLELNEGSIKNARFDLLDRLNLVPFAGQDHPYSVLIQHQTEFVVKLPPRQI